MTARQGQEGVLTEVKDKQQSIIFQNPVKDQFTVSVSPEHSGPVYFELINAAGITRTVPEPKNARPGENAEVNIAAHSIDAGIYLLKIKSDALTELVKVLVTE